MEAESLAGLIALARIARSWSVWDQQLRTLERRILTVVTYLDAAKFTIRYNFRPIVDLN